MTTERVQLVHTPDSLPERLNAAAAKFDMGSDPHTAALMREASSHIASLEALQNAEDPLGWIACPDCGSRMALNSRRCGAEGQPG